MGRRVVCAIKSSSPSNSPIVSIIKSQSQISLGNDSSSTMPKAHSNTHTASYFQVAFIAPASLIVPAITCCSIGVSNSRALYFSERKSSAYTLSSSEYSPSLIDKAHIIEANEHTARSMTSFLSRGVTSSVS